ncbi:MAG: 1-acyl-sn-glycerol-3-phosphate acyltransferase [Myxococcota bacterium]|nr:1-acyl-sn-glycerol-3-phosphate acyltransferase [Myxococcota bacterium]
MSSSRTIAQSQALRLVHLTARVFFRRIQVAGTEHLPREEGALLVAWHPNGIVDPMLILNRCPGTVVFGARHGLFRWPLLGLIMRSLGTVPIFRPKDFAHRTKEELREQNQQSLDALANAVATGSYAALFPEGVSHDNPHPLALKTGAARLYYRARALRPDSAHPPKIIPVGLHYDRKKVYRSRAMVAFHAPLELPEDLDIDPPEDESLEEAKARNLALTQQIESSLSTAALAAESWELHALMHRARKLVRAERARRAGSNPGRSAMKERVAGMARIWTGYQARLATNPELVNPLLSRVREYDADLNALGIEDHELDRSPRLASPWLPILLLVQFIGVFLLMPPIVLAGYVLNIPTALFIGAISKTLAKEHKDVASIKLVAGLVFFPITWGLWMWLAAWGQLEVYATFPGLPRAPIAAALSTLAMAIIGGGLSVRYARVAQETLRALRVRFTRRTRTRTLARLKTERSEIHDAILLLADGIELPGSVGEDGKVHWT